MSNNQERLALEWATRIKSVPREYHDETYHAVADIVLAHIKPPTMEDVEWDHEEHYLAGATHEDCTEVIMHSRVDATEIATIRPGDDDHDGRDWSDKLFPNGKKYQLVEVTVSPDENVAPDQPEHPEFLGTREEYEAAPAGTIIAKDGEPPLMKDAIGDWQVRHRVVRTASLAGYRYRVLRWGWGDEA